MSCGAGVGSPASGNADSTSYVDSRRLRTAYTARLRHGGVGTTGWTRLTPIC